MPPLLPKAGLVTLANSTARRHALEPALVCATIEQESDWNPFALRYEPVFRVRYVAPLNLAPTEEISRSMSWGLMQVMGQVAREHGFAETFLGSLCDPQKNLEIGCAILRAMLAASAGDTVSALRLWNGGADPDYALQVLGRISHYK
ncbi:MAG: lytic transglycosylase domain-containing protein [Candidatus Acidiferrales bacterium]